MKKTYNPVVLEVIRKNGEKRYVSVIDTCEKRSFLFWSWLDCVNREYFSVKNMQAKGKRDYYSDPTNFWSIRRGDEIIPKESVMFSDPHSAENVANVEIKKRVERDIIKYQTSIISVNQIN